MKKNLFYLVALITSVTLSISSYAQVSDVSVIVTPTVGYNWFDDKSTIEDGMMIGGQVGFGFGKNLELRGIYEKSVDMKQNFNKYQDDINEVFPDFNFSDREVEVTRVGGEFKGNIPIRNFAPYLTLGTGVQTMKRDVETMIAGQTIPVIEKQKTQSIYTTGGLGLKLNIGDRATFNVEGKTYIYNLDPADMLYNEGGSSEFDDWLNNQEKDRMFNWSLNAGLQLYLGGDVYGNSEIDNAYQRRYSSGLSNVKLVLSPGGAYVNFHDDSPYRNAYFLGGTLGFDLSDLVGFRGFYYQATNDEKLSFDFDKMAMYGGEFVGRLNFPRGIVPFLTIGAGYLNVEDGYNGKSYLGQTNTGLDTMFTMNAESAYFAKGGLGLNIPLGKYFEVFGSANLMYTVEDNNTELTDLRSPDELRQHTMYNAGLRIKVGRSINDPGSIYTNNIENMQSEYDARIEKLQKELDEAYAKNDADNAVRIIKEKQMIEEQNDALYNGVYRTDRAVISSPNQLVALTPKELDDLVNKVIDGVNTDNQNISTTQRLDRLERLLLDVNQIPATTSSTGTIITPTTDINQRIIEELRATNARIDQQNAIIQSQAYNTQGQIVTTNTPTVATTTPVVTSSNTSVGRVNGVTTYNGLAPYLGVNFGDATTFNIGLRGYYGFSNTKIKFVPEAYIATGDKLGLGISANGLYDFDIASTSYRLRPYVGLGLGFHLLGGDATFNPNFIVGANYLIGNSHAFIDYTARGAFRNNQIAIGYKFGL